MIILLANGFALHSPQHEQTFIINADTYDHQAGYILSQTSIKNLVANMFFVQALYGAEQIFFNTTIDCFAVKHALHTLWSISN